MFNEIDATTTFYALTAPVKGYTLEDQVLGPLTLREWLRKYDYHQFAADDLAERCAEDVRFWHDERCVDVRLMDGGQVEPFTAAELLNRLRLDAMGEEGYIQ